MLRRVPRRSVTLALVLTALFVCAYYAWNPPSKPPQVSNDAKSAMISSELFDTNDSNTSRTSYTPLEPSRTNKEVCQALPLQGADMETAEIYPTLNFNAKWIERREFWNDKMEKRYRHRRKDVWSKLPLKVIIMPHSHNDPGWLKTFEGYFHQATKNILDNAVTKLIKYKSLTFVWTEMSFLHLWWEQAHEVDRNNLKELVKEGRFEILTGGWIMTDEANVHLYAMVDQLIEASNDVLGNGDEIFTYPFLPITGHQWVLSTLGVRPKSSWSVDPFGHGGTFPYILKSSGVDGMVIMRIHYAWKEYFAIQQTGDFMWQQRWDQSGKGSILCHNFPYDIYSIKGSCGPYAQTCVQYNFAVNPGTYSEYASRNIPINPANLRERAETLLDQYGRTGSLFPHNVVLVPLGDDFFYTNEKEWDQQYANYKMLIDFINEHKDEYHANVRFGTLSEYFDEVRARSTKFDSLSGDFFVYSDIFTDGIPAYWSGYFTTRPFMKQLSRELEHNLRAAEILFTISYQGSMQRKEEYVSGLLNHRYYDLVQARRHLALFQHHDAITGTSKQFVMHDYGIKLFDGLIKTRSLQRTAIQYLMTPEGKTPNLDSRIFTSDYERHDYGSESKPLALDLKSGDQMIVVFNPLGSVKHDVVSFFVERQNHAICIKDPDEKYVPYQTNPTWKSGDYFRIDTGLVEIVFAVKLMPLSIHKYKVHFCDNSIKMEPTQVYCLRCPKKDILDLAMKPMPDGSVVIENSHYSLVFDEDTRLLATITHKSSGKTENVQMSFGGYSTMPFRNGAYLFKTDPQKPDTVLVFESETLTEAVIISGPVFSELSLVFEGPKGASFIHTVRLMHSPKGSPTSSGIYVENTVDFGDVENFRDIDFFMRLKTGIKNGGRKGPPVFYSDQNGFQMQRRVKATNVSIEGNIFPITTMAYIEDEKFRLSIVVDHAQAAASWHQGWLELVIDRRSSYDDARGMGEGVLDSRPMTHKYWILFEPQNIETDFKAGHRESKGSSLPSSVAHHLSRYLNYPSIQYVGNHPESDKLVIPKIHGLQKSLPCDVHILNFRTLANLSSTNFPSNEALLILHVQTPDCTLDGIHPITGCVMSSNANKSFHENLLDLGSRIRLKHFTRTGLTGNTPSNQTSSRDEPFPLAPMVLETVKIEF